ncbi:tyrosine-type recombinase/integrase [Hymenobacter edaphi]|uniref:tyrosine-type recombinase/integrase n=1 Tax=Hymenobacter edaphi TaxID=2211146 RepID=UPI00105823ED|nr:tyrosine-type recombinase/integrase [Hymenobacter edaphi]
MQRLPVHRRKIKVSFFPRLAAINKAGYCPVRITMRWHNQELLLDTGEHVMSEKKGKKGEAVSLWDKEARRVTRDHPQHVSINGRLNDWERDVTDAFYDLWDAAPFEKITKEALHRHLFPEAEAKPDVSQQTWREVLEDWKEKNRHLAADSLRKYDQMATMMESWRPALRPGHFGEDVAKEYLNHLLDGELSDAAIKVHFTGIRKCLERLGRPTDASWLQYSAKNAPQLDLEVEELRRLIRYRPTASHLAEERDRWLFQCFSGRRYEDLEKFEHSRQRTTLTLEDGRQVPALLHVQGKTGLDAAVPLPPIAVLIGERWNWQFPRRREQDRNEWIKQVAKEAGLDREWDDRLITGGKVKHNWRPVHQVISSHTARHTAATLLKQASQNNKALAKLVLGHADQDVTDRYAKDKARLLAPAVLDAWKVILGDWYDQVPVDAS